MACAQALTPGQTDPSTLTSDRGAVPDGATLPRVFLDTTFALPTGSTIVVNAGGNLQAAINAAKPGDTIVLQAGATFTGPFTLPGKGNGNSWIHIRSSGMLPKPGNRVSPANVANMATIVGTGKPVIALQTQGAAHHYRLVGIEFKPAAGLFATSLIRLGTSAETSLAQLPHDLVIDRCYIHGDPVLGGRRGIALGSASTAVIDSYLSDWKEVGADSQAIAGWNTPGPVKIVNNYLEGAGENLMFGGADPSIRDLVPSDIEIRGNHFAKPLAWRGGPWTIKNLLESKSSARMLVEGNVFENSWEAAQDFAINIKSAAGAGSPWTVTKDITFRHNIVRHVSSAIKFCGSGCDGPSAQGSRYLVHDNLFEDVDSARWGGTGTFLLVANATPGLVVTRNTVIHSGNTFSGGDGGAGANAGFVFTDNIVSRGPYGFKGTGAEDGNSTLKTYFPGAVFTRNAIVGGVVANYPAGNLFPATYAALGFSNAAGGDYTLAPGSPYRGAGTSGTDIGAHMPALLAATRCAIGGQCNP